MAYADKTDGSRIILKGEGAVSVVLSAACKAGDLLGLSGGTWVLADGNASVYAELVAGISGASGDTITAYRRAIVRHADSGGAKGDLLYLSDTAGGTSASAGTVAQVVGQVIDVVASTHTDYLLSPQYSAGIGGQLIPAAVKLFFRDTGLFIHSNADGKLTISADGAGMDDIILSGMVQPSRSVRPANMQAETVSTDKTLDEGDIGVLQVVDTDAKTVTLPATVVGYVYTIMNGGADGTVAVAVSPNAADKIMGNGFTSADNKDAINTKATAKKGDYITLVGDGVNGWMVAEVVGTWAREA